MTPRARMLALRFLVAFAVWAVGFSLLLLGLPGVGFGLVVISFAIPTAVSRIDAEKQMVRTLRLIPVQLCPRCKMKPVYRYLSNTYDCRCGRLYWAEAFRRSGIPVPHECTSLNEALGHEAFEKWINETVEGEHGVAPDAEGG